MKVEVTVHPSGLHPKKAAKAWYLRREEGLGWEEIAGQIPNMQGAPAGVHAVRNAVESIDELEPGQIIPESKYGNCGRPKGLSVEQEKEVVEFVKTWRHKRFCTCRYIINELKLSVSRRTVARVLNAHGYYWRAVPKKSHLTGEQLRKRRVFVEMFENKSPSWWERNFNLVLDGVTITTAPMPLKSREKHAAQAIKQMWVRTGESLDNELAAYNRYGVQLGTQVPLWGGMTGGGKFTLRLWTPRAKMTKLDWVGHMPSVKRAVDDAVARGDTRETKKAKVWHDNEGFLKQPKEYKKHGLQMMLFPPNSGDLNPIETAWAQLRRDLALREQHDLQNGVYLTVAQFRKRAAQILKTYETPKPGKEHSFLTSLVRGMPKRLARCKKNKFGRSGK